MRTNRLTALLLLIMVAVPMALTAKEPLDAKRAQISIPAFYSNMTPEEYWEMRDEYYAKNGLDKVFKRDALDNIDFIEFKTLEHQLFKDGFKPYDNKRIHDPDGEVFRIMNVLPKGELNIHIPNEIPGDTISLFYVVETDGRVGPIYMTEGHQYNKDAIAKILRKTHFSAPAIWQKKPVRGVRGITIVTNKPRNQK